MLDSLALASSVAPPAPFFSFAEAPSSPPSGFRVPASKAPPSSASPPEPPLDYPRFDVDVVHDDVLQLRILSQPVPDARRSLSPHLVQGRLREGVLDLELYAILRRRTALVSSGIWAAGDYVH